MVDFLKNLKLSLKNLELSEIISIFAQRTMDVFHLLGLGCPRSEELSGSWQLFSYASNPSTTFLRNNKIIARKVNYFRNRVNVLRNRDNLFSMTSQIFAQVGDKKIVNTCVHNDKIHTLAFLRPSVAKHHAFSRCAVFPFRDVVVNE